MFFERIRDEIAELAAMDRGSATEGETRAAERIAQMLRDRGLNPQLEPERSAGGFWQATGTAAALGAIAGLIGGRRRAAGALMGLGAAAAMVDDVSAGPHLLRMALPRRTTRNVLAWAGDPNARETVVLVAHHDSAHTGLLFHPGLLPLVNRVAPRWYARQNTSMQTGRLLLAGPLLAGLGSALGLRRLRLAGTAWSALAAALLADVARSPVVPGANDNLSAVAVLLDVADRLAAEPVEGVRVLLLSTGSEESFMEGMRGFVRRHRAALDPEHTRIVVLECVGSPHLLLMEGEGMVAIREHDEGLRGELQAAADAAGVPLWRGLRLGAGATDALPALRAGYRAACLAGCNDLKAPSNYHWASDVPENLDWSTIAGAGRVALRHIREVGEGARAARRPAPVPA